MRKAKLKAQKEAYGKKGSHWKILSKPEDDNCKFVST